MPSRLQQTIQHYKAQLKQREAQAEQTLDYYHKQTLQLIDAQLETLYQKMSDAQAGLAEGETLPASWLYEANRLQTIEQYITSHIDHFGALTQMQVQQLQHTGVQMGVQAGQALLQAVTPPGVSWAFGMPSAQAIAGMVGATQKGSPLADLFTGFGKEAADKAKSALISGVTLGYNPRQIAPSVQDALNVSRYRALTISRTEMLRSYRGAAHETYRANDDVVDQWRWTCDLSVRTCAACIAMDGTLHDLDEELDEHPCGRCTPVPVTKSWDEILGSQGIDATGIEDTNPAEDMQTGADWFSNQSAETQQAILGNAKYEAYADGKFQLSDLVGKSYDKDWGGSIYERSLKDTLKAANAAPQQAPDVTKPAKSDILPEGLPEADASKWIEDYLRAYVPDPEVFAEPYLAFEEQIAASQAKLKATAEEAEKLALKKQKLSDAAKKGAATKAAKKAALKAAEDAAKAAQAAAEAVSKFTPLEGGMAAKEKYLAENGLKDWIANLSHTETSAIGQYTGNDYREINNYLRGKRDTIAAPLKKTIDHVQEALLKFEAPTDFTVIRGYGNSQLQAFKDALENKGTYIEKGFVSTTLHDKPTFNGFRVIVQVWQGAPGAYIKDVSYFSHEKEYLLPYGAEFKVIDGFTNPGGDKWTFVVEYRGIAQE